MLYKTGIYNSYTPVTVTYPHVIYQSKLVYKHKVYPTGIKRL